MLVTILLNLLLFNVSGQFFFLSTYVWRFFSVTLSLLAVNFVCSMKNSLVSKKTNTSSPKLKYTPSTVTSLQINAFQIFRFDVHFDASFPCFFVLPLTLTFALACTLVYALERKKKEENHWTWLCIGTQNPWKKLHDDR